MKYESTTGQIQYNGNTIENNIKIRENDKFSNHRNIHGQFLFTHAVLFVCRITPWI